MKSRAILLLGIISPKLHEKAVITLKYKKSIYPTWEDVN